MTTPDTSAVRAWARDNGYDVADRGRLPADVTEAYLAANGKGGASKPAAKKAAAGRKAPASASAASKATVKVAPTRGSSGGAAVAKKAAKAAAQAPDEASSAPAAQPAAEQPPAQPSEAPEQKPSSSDASTAKTPRPKPSLVSDDRRLVALGEELAALTKRVEALESAGGKQNGKPGGKTPRFRRRS